MQSAAFMQPTFNCLVEKAHISLFVRILAVEAQVFLPPKPSKLGSLIHYACIFNCFKMIHPQNVLGDKNHCKSNQTQYLF
jgi:hypothetical protein